VGWKFPVIFLGVLGLLVFTVWAASRHVDAVLEEHRQECLPNRQVFPGDVSPRPAILGPEEPGNIWELLLPAFAGFRALDENSNVNDFDAGGNAAGTPRLIERAAPFLQLCRRAARRRDRAFAGSPDPGAIEAERAVRASSSQGLQLWRDGRDAGSGGNGCSWP